MIKRSSQTLIWWFTLSDLTVTALAWVLAYFVRFHSGLPVVKDQPDFRLCLANLPIVVLLAWVAYRWVKQYEIHRLRRFREEVVAVVKGVGLLSLLLMAMSFFRHDPYESRAVMLIFAGLAVVGMLGIRRAGWAIIKHLRRRGYNQANVLIVGTGRTARRLARTFKKSAWLGLQVVGHVEDQPSRWVSDLTILGTTADLPALVERYRVGHVFIALPMNRYAQVRQVFDILSRTLVEVRLVADVPSLAGLSLTTTQLDGMTVIGLRESPHFGLNIVIKRAMDLVLASLALVVLAPLMLAIAVAVRLSSPGPILYRQERCGLNGQRFIMLKFRTMRVDAEANNTPGWTVQNDPRRTRLGAFLRRTSLDELPQLFNVLAGDMSLVGPRPERPHFIEQFSRSIPNYMARHCVKCGVTGWAQVHGWRGNTSLRKRLQYDLYYITHWNPWLDLRILLLTVVRGLFHRNAY
jgi:Undecaprenyl-phosphate glucose phosphotransferase